MSQNTVATIQKPTALQNESPVPTESNSPSSKETSSSDIEAKLLLLESYSKLKALEQKRETSSALKGLGVLTTGVGAFLTYTISSMQKKETGDYEDQVNKCAKNGDICEEIKKPDDHDFGFMSGVLLTLVGISIITTGLTIDPADDEIEDAKLRIKLLETKCGPLLAVGGTF